MMNLEGNEAHVGFFIIQSLLARLSDFRTRVHDFVKDVIIFLSCHELNFLDCD